MSCGISSGSVVAVVVDVGGAAPLAFIITVVVLFKFLVFTISIYIACLL